MKKIFYALSLAAVLLTASCTKDATEDILNGGNNGDNQVAMTTITVGIDNATRVHLGDENDSYMPLYWSEGDKLSLNGETDSAGLTAEQAGSTSAEFQIPASLEGKDLQVIYPADICSTTSHFYLDSEVEYNPEKLAQNQPVLMGFMKAGSTDLQLKHMCGYMRVQLTGSATVKKVMLRTLNHKPISGFYRQTITDEEVSMIDYNKNGLADGYFDSPVTTINCGEGVALTNEPTNFDFAIPAGNYEAGFALTIIDSNNKQQTVAAYKSGKTITAGVMTKMQPLAVNCTQEVGIYDDNAFIGYIRTLEKDCWLDNNNNFNLRADVSLKDFDRSDILKYNCIIYFRSDYTTYNNDDLNVWEGNNYTIGDYKATTSDKSSSMIFGTIEEDWTIQNLKIGRTAGEYADVVFTVNSNVTSGYIYTAILCDDAKGKLINCVNNGSLIVTPVATNGIRAGGITAGGSDSIITNLISGCTNNGTIDIDLTGCTPAGIQVGGIMARQQGGTVTGCTNTGAITVESNYLDNTGAQIGGIVGWGYRNADPEDVSTISKGTAGEIEHTLTNCTNNGPINVTIGGSVGGTTYVGGILGTGWDKYNNLQTNKVTFSGHKNNSNGTITVNVTAGNKNMAGAGIVGLAFHSTSDCNNSGTINVTNSNTSVATHAAGIVGHMTIPNKYNIDNCHNTGTINFTPSSTGNNCLGGISGYTSTEDDNGNENYITSCTNRGALYHKGLGVVRGGGISGSSCRMDGCTNYGSISMTNANNTSESLLGGLNGAQRHNTNNCHNYGNVTALGSSFAGGLIGWTTGGADKRKITSCNVECTVTAADGKAGMMVGELNGSGLTVDKCKVYGTVVSGSNTSTGDSLLDILYARDKANNPARYNIDTAKADGTVSVESTKPAN